MLSKPTDFSALLDVIILGGSFIVALSLPKSYFHDDPLRTQVCLEARRKKA